MAGRWPRGKPRDADAGATRLGLLRQNLHPRSPFGLMIHLFRRPGAVRNDFQSQARLISPKAKLIAGQPKDAFDKIELTDGEPDGGDADAKQVLVALNQRSFVAGALLD